MIEMTCPNCGASGRIPSEKVNTRLVCRKCVHVFFVNRAGHSISGSPPDTGERAHPATHVHSEPDVDQVFGRVKRWAIRLSAAGVLLIAAVILAVLFRPAPLEERANAAAKAVLKGDKDTIRELSAPGTADEAEQWFHKIDSQCGQLRRNLVFYSPLVKVEPAGVDSGGRTAQTPAQLGVQDRIAPNSVGMPDVGVDRSLLEPVRFTMYWTSHGLRGWMLDGRRTLDSIPKSVDLDPSTLVPPQGKARK